MAASRVGAAAGELEECGGGRAGGARRRTDMRWTDGEEKEGDDMWGPHVSEWREM